MWVSCGYSCSNSITTKCRMNVGSTKGRKPMRKKQPKTLESKLRAAIRLIWSRSPQRREVLKQALFKEPKTNNWYFKCAICGLNFHQAMADVDHITPVGALELNKLSEYVDRMFNSPQRVIDKICHKKITAMQRKKAK